jgi:Right handed beta helix region
MLTTGKRLGIGFAIIGALVGASLVAPTAAYAAQPQCGDVVKKDVKLTHDLNCTASGTDGLVIGKDGVDINLNGHKLIGPAGSYNAINDSNGFNSLTVRNGTIRGFAYGVYAYYASKLNLSDLDIMLKGTNDGYGVYAEYGVSPHFDRVTVDNAYYGFYLYSNDDLRLTHSKVTGGDSTQGYGLYDGYSVGKVDHFQASGVYYGAYVYSNTNGYTISNSTFNNAGFAGVYVSNSTPSWQYRYTLSKNTANNADSYGFYASYDVRGSGNKAKGAGTANFYNVPH